MDDAIIALFRRIKPEIWIKCTAGAALTFTLIFMQQIMANEDFLVDDLEEE